MTIGGADTCCALEPVGATLSRILGDTLVSQGARYIKGSEGKALKRGDRVTVMEGGKATISFDDDCNYTLEDDEVLTITDVSPCSTRAALSRIEGDAGLIREGVSNKDRKARG